MDAKAHPVVAVLGDSRRFTVPIYQRQYSWDIRLLLQFWDDVVSKAEEVILGKPKFEHYMGALILAPGSDGYKVGSTPKVQVVDGQQRLTTFQIFLAALRAVSTDLGYEDVAISLESYVFNVPKAGESADAKYKLIPTPNDRDVFHELMISTWSEVKARHPSWFYKNGNLIWGSAPKAVRAFAYFSSWMIDYAKFGIKDEEEDRDERVPDSAEVQRQRLEALANALLQFLKLVVITLEDGDDAQVIFETLNSKSEPLLAMDLVRNNIFHRASAAGESAELLFEQKWSRFDTIFWKSDAPRAKPKRPRIDHFLSHALTAQTGQETSLRELYAEYRAFTRPHGKARFETVELELEALTQFAPIYQSLEEPDGSDLGWLGEKLAVWEVAVVYPVVFQIARSSIDDEEKRTLYRHLYSYVVRRALCGLTAKNLNNNFQRLAAEFLAAGPSMETLTSFFARQTAPTIRFPDDQEFRAGMRDQPIYQLMGRKERIVDVLWELERASRSRFQIDAPRPSELSIEHVLPQGWRSHWPLTEASLSEESEPIALEAKRDRVLHSLGNLTLVTAPLNSSLSNGPFEEKKGPLSQSLLALNAEFDLRPVWDETAIGDRAAALAQLACKIWPAPVTA